MGAQAVDEHEETLPPDRPPTFMAVAVCPKHGDRAGEAIELPSVRQGRSIVMSGASEPVCPCRR
jgi:hypothetical protein